MKINWRVRFKNKTWLLTFIAAVLTLVYRTLNVLGITPHVAQEQLVELATMLVGILVLLGVVIDPTTKGGGDSNAAMTYRTPNDDSQEAEIRPMADENKNINEEAIAEGLKNAEVLDNGDSRTNR